MQMQMQSVNGLQKDKKGSIKHKQNFIEGAVILTIGMLLVKIVGALFKIPLANIITENGMGYFGTAYAFYSVVYSLATAGFPIAVARMVAENYSLKRYNDIRKIRRVSFPVFLIMGIIGTLCMVIGAPLYTKAVGNSGAFLSMAVLSPSIIFCCLSSVYRGYYEGLSNMLPTAVSQITESLSKLLLGLSAALCTVYFLNGEFAQYGTVLGEALSASDAALKVYSLAAAASISGVTLGSFFSFLYLFIYHKRKGDGITKEMYRMSPMPHKSKSVAKKLLLTAIPIGIGALAMSIATLIDSTLLQNKLGEIMAADPATVLQMYEGLIPKENLSDVSTIPNFLWGCYSNAMTVFMLVGSVTQAIGISALPGLTEAYTKKNKAQIKKNVESVLRVTGLFCIPAGVGICVLSEPIAKFIYGSTSGSNITAKILVVLGIAAIFAALTTPITSMLQAVGRMEIPVIFIVSSLVIKVLINYFVCSIPEINILGAGTGTLICYLFVTVAELIAIKKVTKANVSVKDAMLRPFIAALFCGAAAYLMSNLIKNIGLDIKLNCVLSIVFAVIIYAVSVLLLKAVTKDEILMLPKGEKISKILEKHGWIR
ncbi:MAG: polysaccharide biosynthesis protein [Ruminococcaceae bacterium]|nr:polysaccharide biosynthesis protein [Oscillospiraceae bacterium]